MKDGAAHDSVPIQRGLQLVLGLAYANTMC